MSMLQKIIGNLRLIGRFSPDGIDYPHAGITDDAISEVANIAATKVQQQYIVGTRQAAGADVASKTEDTYTARAAGTLDGVYVYNGVAATGGNKKFTVDVQKGNQSTGFATVLTAPVTMDNTRADRQVVTATLTGTITHAAGDTYRVIVTASGSTGSQAQGCNVELVTREAAE